MIDYYVYNADVYCPACAGEIRRRIDTQVPKPLIDRDDSEDYPQGPYSGDESDVPQHCGSHADCLEAIVLSNGLKIGKFLENTLTDEGVKWVKQAAKNRRGDNEVMNLWTNYYGLDEDDDEQT
jgi:hypothetical protein